MRSYIFTIEERRLLKNWLEKGEEDDKTRKIFTLIRRNTPQLTRDLTLLSKVTRELSRQNRFIGRAGFPKGSRSVSQRVASESILRLRGRSI